jgi:hypothetical protein
VTSQRRSTTSEQEIDMKVRALLGAGLIATIGGTLLAPAAHAADTTQVTFALTTGTLSVSVDEAGGAGANLGSVAADDLTTASPTVSGNLRATTVTDTRNSTAGWTVSASSTTFNIADTDPVTPGNQAADSSNAIPVANVHIDIPLTEAVNVIVRGVTKVATDGDASTLGDAFVPTAGTTGAGGAIGSLTSTGLTTILGTLTGGLLGGSSNHSLTYTPEASITVPAGRMAGTYTGVITQTAV